MKNMLSKIVESAHIEKVEFKPYVSPSIDELELIIADKLREDQRRRVIDENKEDPVKAAHKEANRIMIEAQEKLKEAAVEAEVLKNKKEKELRMQLEKEFQGKLEQKLSQLQQNYTKSLEEIARFKNLLFKKSEKEMMELVFSITRKILDEEIKTSPDVIIHMLKKGFERVKDARECEIKVNPLDYDIIAKKKDEIGEIIKTSGTVKFTKDEHVERGGCQIITELGEISSEPGKQMDIIMRELSNGA